MLAVQPVSCTSELMGFCWGGKGAGEALPYIYWVLAPYVTLFHPYGSLKVKEQLCLIL